MDDTDPCLYMGKTSVLSDPAVVARRKRMEIRRFKKLSSSTQLLQDDLCPLENNTFGLKRARLAQTTGCLSEHQEKSFFPPGYLHTDVSYSVQSEARVLPLLNDKQIDKLGDVGLLRYKSLPARDWKVSEPRVRISKARRRGPDVDADTASTAARKEQSSYLLPRILKEQIAGLSSSEAACSTSSQLVSSSMVEVTEQVEIAIVAAELEIPFPVAGQGISSSQVAAKNVTALSANVAGTSDAEMVDLANQSSTLLSPKDALLFSSRNIASACHSPSNSNCPPSGKLLVCGRRREMEDTATIAPSFTQIRRDVPGSCSCNEKVDDRPVCDLHFFAVYDGHGGSQASKFCEERLHHALAEELSLVQEVNVELGQEANVEPSGSSISSTWEKALSSCFSKMDREVGGVCPSGQCEDVDSGATCCQDSIAPENVGTTAVVAVVSSCQIVVANCGDSRAVLSRGGKAIPLSRDHKPDRDDEYTRIEAAGGRVIYWDGYRVGGLLALSRAIGDRYLKRYVVSEPEVTCLQRTEEDDCLILASDGLWDVISNDTACEIARKGLDFSRKKRASRTSALGEDPASADVAALLVKLAYGRGSKDNISVVVIDLKA